MRDILLTLIVLGSLPFILRKPFIGVLVWTWLGLMNPQKLTWGFAYNFPFSQLVALVLLVSLLISKEEKRIPRMPLSTTLAFFWAWTVVTSFFALNQAECWYQLEKVSKIFLLIFVTMMLLNSEERVKSLVWVMMISLGLYGVKGGLFTLMTGGGYHVMGPANTFIGGNNEIGLAMIMTVPLMKYVQLDTEKRWLKRTMTVSMGLTLFAILGTQSRGALLGLIAMAGYLWLKSRQKALLLVFLIAVLPAALMFMPESWHHRMSTIETYQKDKSAEGRINAWWTAWYLALDRPLVGGGFETFREFAFDRYAPNKADAREVHSIYFEALGEHGFVGLFLFLGIGVLALRSAKSIVRHTKDDPNRYWMRDLAAMVHVSLIGYAVSGAFLGLAYFDYYYALIAVLVGMERLLKEQVAVPAPGGERIAPGLEAARPRLGPAVAARRPIGQPRPALWLHWRTWYAKM